MPLKGPPARDIQAIEESTSSPEGKRPADFFEKRSRPPTVISKAPPRLSRSLTSAPGVLDRIKSRASRARGS
jgi:hypothetical protein